MNRSRGTQSFRPWQVFRSLAPPSTISRPPRIGPSDPSSRIAIRENRSSGQVLPTQLAAGASARIGPWPAVRSMAYSSTSGET